MSKSHFTAGEGGGFDDEEADADDNEMMNNVDYTSVSSPSFAQELASLDFLDYPLLFHDFGAIAESMSGQVEDEDEVEQPKQKRKRSGTLAAIQDAMLPKTSGDRDEGERKTMMKIPKGYISAFNFFAVENRKELLKQQLYKKVIKHLKKQICWQHRILTGYYSPATAVSERAEQGHRSDMETALARGKEKARR
jgi:hypothetical protein